MIRIANIDKDVRTHGPHTYELRINNKVICTFIHNREDSLSECLFRAALAADKKLGDYKFTPPRYDEVYFDGLRFLNDMANEICDEMYTKK